MATPKKTAVLDVQAELRKELDTLKERVDPPSGFMIGTNGKVFTLPDGSASDGPLVCVILDWVSANSWFKGIYNPKDIKPPVCYAVARNVVEMSPSDQVPEDQSNIGEKADGTCHNCLKNQFNSDPSGGKGKACKNTRKLLVVPADAEEGTPPWVLSVSPTGLKHFDKYVNTLKDVGTHPLEVVTEISFEASEAFPSLRFKAAQKHDNVNVMWALKGNGQEILLQEPKAEEKAA